MHPHKKCVRCEWAPQTTPPTSGRKPMASWCECWRWRPSHACDACCSAHQRQRQRQHPHSHPHSHAHSLTHTETERAKPQPQPQPQARSSREAPSRSASAPRSRPGGCSGRTARRARLPTRSRACRSLCGRPTSATGAFARWRPCPRRRGRRGTTHRCPSAPAAACREPARRRPFRC